MSWYLTYGQTIRYDRSFDTKEEAVKFIHENPGYRADGLYNLQYGVSVREGELDDGTAADDADDMADRSYERCGNLFPDPAGRILSALGLFPDSDSVIGIRHQRQKLHIILLRDETCPNPAENRLRIPNAMICSGFSAKIRERN